MAVPQAFSAKSAIQWGEPHIVGVNRISTVRTTPDFQLELGFQNGERRRFDMRPLLSMRPWNRIVASPVSLRCNQLKGSHGTRLSDYSPVIMEVLTPVTRYM